MKKALLLLVLFTVTVLAVPINITFSEDNSTTYMQGKDYTIDVKVKNNANVTDTINVAVRTDGTDVLVNKSRKYEYTITNLTSGSTNTKSVKIKISDNMSFDKERYFQVTASDSNGTDTIKEILITTPKFDKILLTLTYDPEDDNNPELKIEGMTDTDKKTYRFNATVLVKPYGTADACFNITDNGTADDDNMKLTLDMENCSSGLFNIYVDAVADEHKETAKIEKYFFFRNINLTASFWRREAFDFERPFHEVERLESNDTIIIRGTAKYGDGTAVSHYPDDSDNYVELTIENYYNTTTGKTKSYDDYTANVTPDSDGSYEFIFQAPVDNDEYDLTILAFGMYSYDSKITYDLLVDNVKVYEHDPVNASGLLANVNISMFTKDFTVTQSVLTLDVKIGNQNNVSITGRPTIAQTGQGVQFNVQKPSSTTLLSGKERNYSFTITPKKFTKPGDYDVNLVYDTVYGQTTKPLTITIPAVTETSNELNNFRYIEYSDNSKVTLRLVNKKSVPVKTTIRETISKEIASTLKTTNDLLSECNSTDYPCRLNVILNNGTCSDCTKLSGNATDNYTLDCDDNCTERSFINFETKYTRVIQDDPVIEWDVTVQPNKEVELIYYTAKLVDEEWFTEPNITTTDKALPKPKPTKVPTVTPLGNTSVSPTATATPTIPPTSQEKFVSGLLLAFGVVFLLVVLVFLAVAVLFVTRRKDVDKILEKYLPVEIEETTEEKERKRLKTMFISEAEEKQAKLAKAEAKKKKLETKKQSKNSLLKKLDALFSPKPKSSGPTSVVPKKVASKKVEKSKTKKNKEEVDPFDNLKEIGKGFGENN